MDEREQEVVRRETVRQEAVEDELISRAIGEITNTPIIKTSSVEPVITDETVVKHVLYPQDIELPPDVDFLIEPLAAYAHDTWSNWMLWLFRFGKKNEDGTFTIQADRVARWERQMNTLYQFLPEDEQESDREEAREILKILYKMLM